jgi:hypothetical protein
LGFCYEVGLCIKTSDICLVGGALSARHLEQ